MTGNFMLLKDFVRELQAAQAGKNDITHLGLSARWHDGAQMQLVSTKGDDLHSQQNNKF